MRWGHSGIKIDLGGKSCHHLFSYDEVRKKMYKITGQLKNEREHITFGNNCRLIMNNMPIVLISFDKHKELHVGKTYMKKKILQEK